MGYLSNEELAALENFFAPVKPKPKKKLGTRAKADLKEIARDFCYDFLPGMEDIEDRLDACLTEEEATAILTMCRRMGTPKEAYLRQQTIEGLREERKAARAVAAVTC